MFKSIHVLLGDDELTFSFNTDCDFLTAWKQIADCLRDFDYDIEIACHGIKLTLS